MKNRIQKSGGKRQEAEVRRQKAGAENQQLETRN
jgi:hypothetical protein